MVRRDDELIYWETLEAATITNKEMLATRQTIKYRIGGRWFKASSPPMNAYKSCIEVSRIYALPGVSKVIVYDENGKTVEIWNKAYWRREDRVTDRDRKNFKPLTKDY
ncbi:MAG TPA: hypothetical protein VEP90_10345 [Methylomirabilota bacterium]|nr:hypothetical protein [Methylomirabilota bacterium]